MHINIYVAAYVRTYVTNHLCTSLTIPLRPIIREYCGSTREYGTERTGRNCVADVCRVGGLWKLNARTFSSGTT